MKQGSIKTNTFFYIVRQITFVLNGLIVFPYVSRALCSDNMGAVSFSESVVNYFVLIAGFGINNYAIREGSKRRNDIDEFNKFANQIFTINILSTLFSFFLFLLMIVFWHKTESYRSFLFISSLNIFSATIGINWFYNALEDFRYIALKGILTHIVSMLAIFILVKNSSDSIIYLSIIILTEFIACVYSFLNARRVMNIRITKDTEIQKHFKPLLILFFNSLISSVYVNSDITLLGIFQDDKTVGTYYAATRIYTIIKNLLSSIILVTLPKLSIYAKDADSQNYAILSKKVFDALMCILLPASVGLFCLSKNIILVLSGTDYLSGVTSLKILSISLVFSLTAWYFTTSILIPNKKEKRVLTATLFSSLFNFVSNLFIIPRYSLNGAAFTTLLAEISVMIIAGSEAMKHISFKVFNKDLLIDLIGCLFIFLICNTRNVLQLNLFYETASSIAISVLVYFLVLYLGKHSIFISAVDSLKNRFFN